MKFINDLKQAYSWGSLSHPFSSKDNQFKLTWKEAGACGGIAVGVGLATLPAFPFTAFAAYYLSRHYILQKKITRIDSSNQPPASEKTDKTARNSGSLSSL